MLNTLIIKEIHDSFVSLRFVITLLLCTVMILLAIWTGVEDYRHNLKNYYANEFLSRQALEEQPNYYSLGAQGVKISRKPVVLQSLVSGITDIVGDVASVAGNGKVELEGSKSTSSPLFAVFGNFDLTFVFSILFSLLALLYSYNAVTGEKERGTLKLCLANSVSRPTIILGKYLGNLISLLLPLLVPLVFGLIVMASYPEVALNQEHWVRIALLVVLYVLYITTFFSLGILSSALVSRSSISLLIALLSWVVFIAMIPRISLVFADMLLPVTSQSELTFRKEAVQREIEANIHRKYNVDSLIIKNQDLVHAENQQPWKNLTKEFWAKRSNERIKRLEEQFSLIEEEFGMKQQAQHQLASNLARVSPASALMLGSMNLGGTGQLEHDRFMRSVKEYQLVFAKWVNAEKLDSRPSTVSDMPKPDLSSMPRHTFTRTSLAESISRAIPDFLVLILMNILFFAGAYVCFLRYDVR